MPSIIIETSQNVEIEHNLASIGERIGATALDLLFQLAYIFLALFLGKYLNGIAIYLLYWPLGFYSLACELVLHGQTFGKMIVKTKVAKLDGSELRFYELFMRWALRPIDITFTYGSVGILSILIGGKGQRLGDMAAGTCVLSLTEKKIDHSIFENIDEQYKPIHPQVAILSDNDIAIMRDVMEFVSQTKSDRSINMAYLTKTKLEKKMGITSTLSAKAFFDEILRDYTGYHSRIN